MPGAPCQLLLPCPLPLAHRPPPCTQYVPQGCSPEFLPTTHSQGLPVAEMCPSLETCPLEEGDRATSSLRPKPPSPSAALWCYGKGLWVARRAVGIQAGLSSEMRPRQGVGFGWWEPTLIQGSQPDLFLACLIQGCGNSAVSSLAPHTHPDPSHLFPLIQGRQEDV